MQLGYFTRLNVVIYFVLFSFFFLFLNSWDSYLYDTSHSGIDPTWFFMCGRAWMNGLTPYVDFADCKGPLLWLIYGVGSLLHPHSFVGVFWISVAFFAVLFYFIHHTALLMVDDQRWAMICVLPLAFLLFLPIVHDEVRAEDFCNTFLMVSLYITCRLLYGPTLPEGARWSHGFALGACFGALVMIKYNVAAACSVFILFSWLYQYGQCKRRLWVLLLWQLAGLAAVVLPFVIYLHSVGALDDFVQCYFLDAFTTVGDHTPFWLIHPVESIIIIVTTFLCSLLPLFWLKKWKWMPVVVYAFLLLSILKGGYVYYLQTVTLAYLFGLISAAWYLKNRRGVVVSHAVVMLSVVAWPLLTFVSGDRGCLLLKKESELSQGYYQTQYVMSQVPHGKMIFWGFRNTPLMMCTTVLPGCRYWAEQNMPTEAMLADQRMAVLQDKADFVVVRKARKDLNRILQRKGYHAYDLMGDDAAFYHSRVVLYSQRELKLPPKDFRVSKMDLLLKRDLFETD